MNPADCDRRFLELACRLDRYGMDFHLITVPLPHSLSLCLSYYPHTLILSYPHILILPYPHTLTSSFSRMCLVFDCGWGLLPRGSLSSVVRSHSSPNSTTSPGKRWVTSAVLEPAYHTSVHVNQLHDYNDYVCASY